jgi:glucose/arabinose dehydrogenase
VDGGPADAAAEAKAPGTVIFADAGIVVDTLAGGGTAGEAEGTGGAAQFDNPVGVGIAPNGDVFVTEYEGRQVRRVTPAGATSVLYRGFADPFGILVLDDTTALVQTDQSADGHKDNASGTLWRVTQGNATVVVTGLNRPRGLVRLFDGRVALSDRDNQTMSFLDLATSQVSPLAGRIGVTGHVDALGDSARFNQPYGLTLLPDGSILVADYGNNVIRRVTLDGNVSTFAGSGVAGLKDDPDKTKAEFDGPQDVAADEVGNVYVSDSNNFRIRRITTTGGVETVAGNGIQGFADGPGAEASFYGQEQLDTTDDGKYVFVSDGNRGAVGQPYNRIRRITIP